MDKMKNNMRIHSLKALIKPVEIPSETLAIGPDERHDSIPLLIFTNQHLPTVKPTAVKLNQLAYEDVQRSGTGASLSLDDFETDNFSIGTPYMAI